MPHSQTLRPICGQRSMNLNLPKTVQRELPHFTVAQMAAIANAAKTRMYRSLFALAAGTGARAGELFALWVESDVDLDERTITIRRSVFDRHGNAALEDTGCSRTTRHIQRRLKTVARGDNLTE